MDKRIALIAGLTALFAMGSAHAYVCPTVVPVKLIVPNNINPETGHTFDVYKADGICWADAQNFVNGLDPQGSPTTLPHLATITSSRENQWIVDTLLTPALNLDTPLEQSQVWVGGSRDAGAWRWENSEGPFSGSPLNDGIGYTNWVNGEPNNTLPGENHLTLGRYPTLYGWNDEGSAVGSIGGFIVEYDTPREQGDGVCETTGTTTTCATVGGQTMTFPPGTFTGNSSFTFTAFEFTDPRIDAISGRCDDRRPLALFTDDAFNLPNTAPGSQSGKLVIPAYLCGSPKFLVVRAVGTNITIPKGVVITENDTQVILPGNVYDCNPTIPASESPQQQDVGVWQSLDATEMWENAPTFPVTRFAGTATELTTACASTLLKSRTKSNFVVGLHFDFDVAFDSAAEYNEIVALTQYKISLLRQSVVAARARGRISDANGRAMLSQLDAAAAALTANNPVLARKKIQDFLNKVNSSTYSTNLTDPFNFNGDHLSRGENIRFTLSHKAIPFNPVP